MMGNIYTDFKELKTKNIWHLLFLMIGIILSLILKVNLLEILGVIIIALAIGLIRENTRSIRIAAGDTKMISIMSLYCLIVFPHSNILGMPLFLHLVIFTFSLILTGFISLALLLKSFLRFKHVTGYHSFTLQKMNVSFVTEGVKVIKGSFCIPASLSVLGGTLMYIYIYIYIIVMRIE